MLSDETVEEFWREGYIVVRGLVDRGSVAAVLEAGKRFAPPEEGGGWSARVFEHAAPEKDRDLHQLLWHESVVGAVERILESPPRIWYGMFAVVPARGGTGLPWHQDNQYTQILGGALNTFIALSEVTPERANLWVAPRSHVNGRQPARPSDLYNGAHREAVVAPENGICLPTLQPGDACIFDRCTYHRSLKNETDQHRFAYAAQYLADNARLAGTGKKDPLRMRARELAVSSLRPAARCTEMQAP
ncbi:MAG TPA: phytanoyl-CoA dioxygenase family protein [Chthonomonadaceae bacterium]|nr:phytanoyl-CoA dioxygenase family protein [Chthonomonadaceae bacterium]